MMCAAPQLNSTMENTKMSNGMSKIAFNFYFYFYFVFICSKFRSEILGNLICAMKLTFLMKINKKNKFTSFFELHIFILHMPLMISVPI